MLVRLDRGQQRHKAGRIDGVVGVWVELDQVGGDQQERLGRRIAGRGPLPQDAAQHLQRLAQVLAGQPLGHIRPEQRREMAAHLRARGLDGQVGQQRPQLVVREAFGRLAAEHHFRTGRAGGSIAWA